MIHVQVGHHDDTDVARLDAARASLCRGRLLGLHLEGVEAPDQAAHVLLRIGGDRRVQACIDQDLADARMLDQEHRRGELEPFLLRRADAPQRRPALPVRAISSRGERM